ncbi:MAG: glycosyltransferase family 4 protein [Thermotogae bacterium]|nr:glycosyltransferase family 4 protein [Thermotogota bacterium]
MRILLLADASSYHTQRWKESLKDKGDEVLTVSLEEGDGDIRLGSFGGKFRYILAVPKVKALTESFKPDIVFSHFLPNYGLIGYLLKLSPKVLALWGSDILHWAFKTPLHTRLARSIISSYDVVIVDAHFLVPLLRDTFKYAGKIIVVPFGVEKELRNSPLRNLPKKPLHFVSIRRHEDLFNHKEILNFLRSLSERFEIRVTYLQDGSRREHIERYARRIGLKVRFMGKVSKNEYVEILKSAHFCISIPHRDASSVSLLECMALGGVPIVSDIPANREWVSESSAIISPPKAEDMLQIFLKRYSWEWWERARSRNKIIIQQRCNWEANVESLRRTFKNLIHE